MKKILNALKGNGCQARMLTAAMTVLSAMAGLTSCANEDTALDNTTAQTAEGRTVQFTATLAPKGDDGGQTRAITVNEQNTANETLNVAWQKDEEIAVYYEKTNGEHATATAIVGAPNDDGSAPITATLTDAKAGKARFVYPATLHDGQGDIDESKLQNSQQGLLTGDNSISTNFDAATGTGTIAVSGSEASVSGSVTMTNRVCICKMTLEFSDTFATISGPSGGKTLTIDVGDGSFYTISSPFKDDDPPVGGPTAYRAFKSGDVIYVAMLPVDSKPVTFTSISGDKKIYSSISSSVNLTAGSFYRNIPLTLTKVAEANKTLTTATGELMLQHGDIVTGTGGENTQLKIEDGATVTLAGVTNTSISHSSATSFPGIECLGDATIILAGVNSVRGVWGKAGIYVPEGKTLTIRGGGKLTATANDGAGIGGNYGASCGNIVIEGGTINATGPGSCAGIGSGGKGSCGTITITGGNITAQGDSGAAGIGSGKEGSCGTISISGSAQVIATGGSEAAGIGSGDTDQAAVTCGDISISGSAQVTATGGSEAAGIGSGHANQAANTCGDISISGSAQVTATGGEYAAGIGSGNGNNYSNGEENYTLYVSSCGTISIGGGTIEARGGNDAAGIGSGSDGKFTSISITSGITSVTATRSNNFFNAPIGKGNDDHGSGGITIDGQTISDDMTNGSESLPTFPNLSIKITGGKDSDNNDMDNKTWTIARQN